MLGSPSAYLFIKNISKIQFIIDKTSFLKYNIWVEIIDPYILQNFPHNDSQNEVISALTRKVAEFITHENAKSRVFSDYLPNASFFLNFG